MTEWPQLKLSDHTLFGVHLALFGEQPYSYLVRHADYAREIFETTKPLVVSLADATRKDAVSAFLYASLQKRVKILVDGFESNTFFEAFDALNPEYGECFYSALDDELRERKENADDPLFITSIGIYSSLPERRRDQFFEHCDNRIELIPLKSGGLEVRVIYVEAPTK